MASQAHELQRASDAATGLPVAHTAALTRHVTRLSLAAACLLVVVKAGVWLAGGSVAVLASLADSGLDVLASLVTFAAVRYAAVPADAEHRYGHGKAEAYASLIQAALVLTSAGLIAREAVERLFDPRPLSHEGWSMAVMALSLVVTGLLVAEQTRVLRRTGSVAVSGDRAHYMADLASSGIALVGIAAASWLDLPAVDAAAGLLVTAWLLWTAYRVFRQTSHHLMDHELSAGDRDTIRALLEQDRAICSVHQLRTRASGPHVHVQAHVDLDAGLSLIAAHEIVAAAEARVTAAFPNADVILHADPQGHAEDHDVDFDESAGAVSVAASSPSRPGLR